jgi:hypothetical protein
MIAIYLPDSRKTSDKPWIHQLPKQAGLVPDE